MKKLNHQHLFTQLEEQLKSIDHKTCITWAALCANHVLFYFTKAYPEDQRPKEAIFAANQFVNNEITVSIARERAFAAHAAARSSSNPSATFAARACGHAAATAHVKTHAINAAKYAIKAVAATKDTVLLLEELKWQLETLTNLKINTQ